MIFNKDDTYHGYYYPEGCLVCEDKIISSPIFEEGVECMLWANEIKTDRYHLQESVSDYAECGKNCKYDNKLDVEVCEETFDITL